MMPEISSARRHWLLVTMLASRHRGLSISEMVTELGVSAKTIRRDLILLQGVGLPLQGTVEDYGRKKWRLEGAGSPVPLSFTFEEAAALHLGRRLLDPLAGTALWDAAQSAFKKVRASLGEAALGHIDTFAQIMHHTAFGARDYAGKSELIEQLQVAIEDCEAVHILYQSDRATEPAYRDVYPYALVYHPHRSALYLIAFDPQEDKIKNYKIDRVEAVERSHFPFQRPADFDPAKYLASSFGVYVGDGKPVRIQVRFAPSVARYVRESQWHPSQKLTPQRDGSLLALYELSSTVELKSWILSFGANAVILEPEVLRTEIVHELKSMARAYGVRNEQRFQLRRARTEVAAPERSTK